MFKSVYCFLGFVFGKRRYWSREDQHNREAVEDNDTHTQVPVAAVGSGVRRRRTSASALRDRNAGLDTRN